MTTLPYRGLLLTEYFLTEGILDRKSWDNLPPARARAFRENVRDIFLRVEHGWKSREDLQKRDGGGRLFFGDNGDSSLFSEAETEHHIIFPLLNLLGWENAYAPQKPLGSDLPDVLLFPKSEVRAWTSEEALREAVAVQENKRWNLPLDSREESAQAPSTQMLRYLTNAASLSGGRMRWGILTNGRHWRLYSQDARSRSEEFLELDLWQIARGEGDDSDHWLRVFLLMFRREAFLPDPELDGRTFHQAAVNEGRLWEMKITGQLSRVLLKDDGALPILARGLEKAMQNQGAPDFLRRLRDTAIVILFRLLFVLYAEDRGLLPVDNPSYRRVSMRKMREEVENGMDAKERVFGDTMSGLYGAFAELCEIIDKGDIPLRIPPYNGGLFSNNADLRGIKIPDRCFARVVDSMSRWMSCGKKRRVNFRDLSVQHLGAVYEQLLEREFETHPRAGIQVRLSPRARKSGGSYYTPESLVRLVLDRAVGRLIDEKIAAFDNAVRRGAAAEELRGLDPAEAVLNLKVCDPAMGSGHFLVSLVDYVADRALEAVVRAEESAPGHRSPLTEKIAGMRESILRRNHKDGFMMDSSRLDDRLLARRMALKRVAYGVDKNEQAAELAKLSLWLHTFTIGAPLSFLDHHLRAGDSLFGERLRPALEHARERGGELFSDNILAEVRKAAGLMDQVENLADADIQQARDSARNYGLFAEKSRAVANFLSLAHAEKWTAAAESVDRKTDRERRQDAESREKAMTAFFSGALGKPENILPDWKPIRRRHESAAVMRGIIARAAELQGRENFLHWEVAFPGVWTPHNGEAPAGGFDAVIGNPPWERMKMQRVEWFAERRPEIAAAETAAKSKAMIDALAKGDPVLAKLYEDAARNAAVAREAACQCGDYPLLSGGDTNLYSLFVERALKLVRPGGMVGLLTPSGIYADQTASEFFSQMLRDRRIAALFDFENRTAVPKKKRARKSAEEAENEDAENGDDSRFFPAVDTRFKFCAFIAGGKGQFPKMESAFCLHSADETLDENLRIDITPEMCKLVNPNTETAPVFCTPRDAKIVTGVYRRVPIMRHNKKPAVWPVRQLRMFDMTGDSGFFRTESEWLQDKYYRVEGGAYQRGSKRALPLYAGKMIFHFNSRAASVVGNPTGVTNPFKSEPAVLKQLQDSEFLPSPRFWVDEAEVGRRLRNFPEGMEWMIGFRGIAATTNERTAIAAVVPRAAVGNQLPLLMPAVPPRPDDGKEKELEEWRRQCELALAKYRAEAPLYLANLCSFALDYVCRRKMQGAGLNWYIMEQLPVIPVSAYGRKFGGKTAGEIVRHHVLRLTYAAEDMRPFARDMGCDGDPFGWDEGEREKLRARLDALYFILYGIGEEEAEYIMSTFPIVERKDRKAHNCFRTWELIRDHMRALERGDPDAPVAPRPAPPPPNPPKKRARKRK